MELPSKLLPPPDCALHIHHERQISDCSCAMRNLDRQISDRSCALHNLQDRQVSDRSCAPHVPQDRQINESQKQTWLLTCYSASTTVRVECPCDSHRQQSDRQTDGRTDTQMGGQTDRWMDKQTHRQRYMDTLTDL